MWATLAKSNIGRGGPNPGIDVDEDQPLGVIFLARTFAAYAFCRRRCQIQHNRDGTVTR